MWMRNPRRLPILIGVAIALSAPLYAAAEPTHARLVPYHSILSNDTDATATDAALAAALARARLKQQLGMPPSGPRAQMQQSYNPYFGKNMVRYDKFEWHIYKTDHFEIFYYPELERHLERVASYAESAYQHISGELQHDLGDRVPLVVFKTQSEFQENNIYGGETPESALAFAEPERNRMVLPIDEPYDQLYALITHELTHIFEFNIIPRGLVGGGLPLWVDEGLADYMTGSWAVLDLVAVRDAALTDTVQKMS